ncbi:GTP-binding protein OBGC, chloroplastic [Dorcoceras hygrometricum]|uniref:GTP-binding protein OBGC, chloroplastic n=1 Tax=Dorcoceras hygrometricum TaxID=472368 RepID=A0A2Z7A8F9_9LAMI|nr:GTP-binding protein OBGC, chloroplastic [Dorcoceras hygrometricum]
MQQRRAMVVQQRRTMETVAPLARDERSNAARPTHGQRATSPPSSRKGAAQNQRTIGQPPPRNISPKQQPSAAHRARPLRDNRASARAHALEREAPPRTEAARRPNQNFDFPILKIKRLDTIWQLVLIRSENYGSDTTVGIRIAPPGEAAEEQKIQVPGDDQYDEQFQLLRHS